MSHTFDLKSVSQAISSGKLSSVELVESYLDRIAMLDAKLHAFIEVYASEARTAAKAAHNLIGAGYCLGPLHGIPVAVKDLVDIRGKATTCGSPLFADQIATTSAELVHRLMQAGAIIIGKTHMVQFALGAWGSNEHMGMPRNPWDRNVHRVPGGSSSGSAVAVAARMTPFAIGTDTGGSVRVPAAYCGITGFKPAVGKIDSTGVKPLSSTLDSVGILSVSASDAALLYEALATPNCSTASSADSAGCRKVGDLNGYRIARLAEKDLTQVGCDVRAAYEASCAVLERLGARIVTMTMPCDFDDFASIAATIMLSEGASEYGALAQDPTLPMDGSVRPRLLAGLKVSAADYISALRQRDRWKRVFLASMDRIDALVTPTTLSTAIPVTEIDHGKPPVRYTRLGNLLDLCAIALPSGFDADGLPTSIQIMCRGGAEDVALEIGTAYQSATDWHARIPDMQLERCQKAY